MQQFNDFQFNSLVLNRFTSLKETIHCTFSAVNNKTTIHFKFKIIFVTLKRSEYISYYLFYRYTILSLFLWNNFHFVFCQRCSANFPWYYVISTLSLMTAFTYLVSLIYHHRFLVDCSFHWILNIKFPFE